MERSGLPNLIVIGLQKCGTSALHYYLGLHPEIEMSAPKELDFFVGTPDFGALPAMPADERAVIPPRRGNWDRGAGWYASHFDPSAAVRGESSPSYTAPWHPQAAANMHTTVPGAKLIVLVRDPVEQIPSAWLHVRALGRERRPLERAIVAGGRYVERIRFRARLEPYLRAFGRERLLVLAQADLLTKRRETIRRAFDFLGVDSGFWSDRMQRRRHVTAAKSRSGRAIERWRTSALARPAYRLPAEAKWLIERGLNRRGEAAETPELPASARKLVATELAAEVAWLGDELGVDTSGWLS